MSCTQFKKGDQVRVIGNCSSVYGSHSFKKGDEFTIIDTCNSKGVPGYIGTVCGRRQTLVEGELELIPKVWEAVCIDPPKLSMKLTRGKVYKVTESTAGREFLDIICADNGQPEGGFFKHRFLPVPVCSPEKDPTKWYGKCIKPTMEQEAEYHLKKGETYELEAIASGSELVKCTDSCGKHRGTWYADRFVPSPYAPKPKACPTSTYIVWSPEGRTPPKRIMTTHASAKKSAREMANRHPGQTFYVMKATEKYSGKKIPPKPVPVEVCVTKEELS